jgi:sialidase-1
MNARAALGAALLAVCPAGRAPAAPPLFQQTAVFRSGENGYHTYRIPALIVTRKGTLLAFSEGRSDGQGDSGAIHTLLRRSADGGRFWSPQQVVAAHGGDTLGNPCPVLDRKTGVIWLLLTGNPGDARESDILKGQGSGTRTVWVTSSADDGRSWTPVAEISRDVKPAGWTWYATGPGNGIQLRGGRLVIPCNHAVLGSEVISSHVIYSDDHGATWKLGGTLSPGTDESAVVELLDGQMLINMRNGAGTPRARAVARSGDKGETWSAVEYDPALVEPVCQASILRWGKGRRSRILFSNPADPRRRVRMTVRASADEGKTWPVSRVVHEGPAGYSSLAVLRDGTIGLLFERGERGYKETVTFARFSLDWLTAAPAAN